jgi:hypothetical protein
MQNRTLASAHMIDAADAASDCGRRDSGWRSAFGAATQMIAGAFSWGPLQGALEVANRIGLTGGAVDAPDGS